MQIKTTVSYHLTSVRMTIIRRQELTSVGKDVEKRELLCTTGANVKWCSHYRKRVWRFLKKLKIELSYDPLSKGNENTNSKGYIHPCVHCSIIYNSQDIEVSIDGWMDKEYVVYRYNGILFSHKKEENLAICNNMDGPWGHYTKWSKSDRERQLPYDLTYMWNLKTKNKKPPS